MSKLSVLTLGFENPALFDDLPPQYRDRYKRIYLDRQTQSIQNIAIREGVTVSRIRQIIESCEFHLKRAAKQRHLSHTLPEMQQDIDRTRAALVETEARAEKAEDALEQIRQWCDAYPADIFTDQDLKLANEVLAAAGISMSGMHGQWARRIVSGIGDIARSVLPPPQEENPHA